MQQIDDGLVALLTAITETKPDWWTILKPAPDMHQIVGGAAKNHLRNVLHKFISDAKTWVEPVRVSDEDLILPPYCSSIEYAGNRFIAKGNTGSEITTFDGAVKINDRKVVVDARSFAWRYAKTKYFRSQALARTTLLDDVFGEGEYDRVLAMPSDCAPHKLFRGVHIAKMPFTKEEFYKRSEELAKAYELLQPVDR